MKKNLEGVISLIPTPLTEEGEIDAESLRSLIDFQIENGCDGVGVLAGIGEGYLMSDRNWRKVAENARAYER